LKQPSNDLALSSADPSTAATAKSRASQDPSVIASTPQAARLAQAIQAQDAQAQVSVALEQGSVEVQSALSRERLAAAIRDEGYEVMA
jgi:copper chaperone